MHNFCFILNFKRLNFRGSLKSKSSAIDFFFTIDHEDRSTRLCELINYALCNLILHHVVFGLWFQRIYIHERIKLKVGKSVDMNFGVGRGWTDPGRPKRKRERKNGGARSVSFTSHTDTSSFHS